MRTELEKARTLAQELPAADLPGLIGELAEVNAVALARLAAPPAAAHDELLDVTETARRLGVSEDYVYRHHRRFSFTRRQGKKLLFSSLGLDRHMSRRV
jgi:hypothetical protein